MAAPVAAATHEDQQRFVEARRKYDSDTATLQKLYGHLQQTRPHMFRRLRGVADIAEKRPKPAKAQVASFQFEMWLRASTYTVVKQLGPGVHLLRDSC